MFLFRAVFSLSATSSRIDHYRTFLTQPVNQRKNYHGRKLSTDVPMVMFQAGHLELRRLVVCHESALELPSPVEGTLSF